MFNKKVDLSDFTTTNSFSSNLYLEQMQHKAKVEINEEGTIATAATAIIWEQQCALHHTHEFFCNHPFLFVIYDSELEQILFTGVYRDPSQNTNLTHGKRIADKVYHCKSKKKR